MTKRDVRAKQAPVEAADNPLERPTVEADTLPDESWGLPDLAKFVLGKLRRTAVDTWWIGKALDIAHGKYTTDRGWLRWLAQDVGLSKSSAYRFMELYKTFSVAEVEGKPLGVLYKLMACKDDDGETGEDGDPGEVASDGGNVEEEDSTGGDDVRDDAAPEEPAIAGRIAAKKSSAAGEQDTDGQAEDEQELPDEPQPPITDDELAALETFIMAVDGKARAEYVLREGLKLLTELEDEHG